MNFLRDTRLGRRAIVAATAALLSLGSWPVAGQRAPADDDSPQTITHVLNRIAFGPRPEDVARVQQMGLRAYIDAQLHPERIDNAALDARLATMTSLSMSSRDLATQFFMPADMLNRQLQQAQPANQTPSPGQQARPQVTPEQRQVRLAAQAVTNELMQAKVLRAALSERQLEEVLVDFWFNHFNVFIGKGQVRQFVTEYERDAIRPYVLGRFRDMLGATAHSPAMLFYLDNFQSQAPPDARTLAPQGRRGRGGLIGRPGQVRPGQPQRPARGLNENYARELMELHTLGVDGGYTQKDVIEVARILTGWTIDQPRAGGAFVFRPQVHDAGRKTVLGVTFDSGKGEEEGERLLDLLAAHPSTARHISFKLAQRFVADEPPAGLVERAAKVFLDTGGDLREVTRTIVTSPEFLSPDAHRAKVKTPLEFVVSAMRATGAAINNAQPLVAALANLGMPLYGAQPPTGYSMTADAWVNTGALLARMNLAVQLIAGTAPLVPDQNMLGGQNRRPAAPRGPGRGGLGRNAVHVDLAAIAPDTSDVTRDRLVETILGGTASAATRDTLTRAESSQQLLALTLGSPEFQRR